MDVDEEFSTLEEALNYISEQFGSDILNDKQMILQYIDTFFPDKKRERNFLNMAYSGGIIKSMLAIRGEPAERQQMFIQQAAFQLEDVYGISEEWANYIVNCIAEVCGIKLHNQSSNIQKKIRAENGDVNAQLELALDYINNDDVENYVYWIKHAIQGGSYKAAFHYGKYLYENNQKSTNKKEGEELLIRSVQSGNIDAACYVARYLNAFKEENRKIVMEFVGNINFDDDILSVDQLLNLTVYFEMQKDINFALYLAELAFEKDYAVSWKRYIELLKKRANPMDSTTIGKVYRQVAEKGNLDAIKNLAEHIEKTTSSASEMRTAMYWYKVAADAGDIAAQLRLAKIYETGDRVDRDINEAIGWYELASANGSKEAYDKISFKSSSCIRETVSLLMEDDSVFECDLKGFLSYQGKDYLVIIDPDSNEYVPLLYRELGTTGDFEVEILDEIEEQDVLRAFRRNR